MCTYLQNCIVFILPHTVVSVEAYADLAKSVMLEKVVQKRHHSVGTFSHIRCFVNQVICLTWDTLTTHSKYSTLSGCFEIHRPWLEWVVRVMDLLCEVERVVGHVWSTTRWSRRIWRRESEYSTSRKVGLDCVFTVLDSTPVERPLLSCPLEVLFCFLECLVS